jgi:hypothetical protein
MAIIDADLNEVHEIEALPSAVYDAVILKEPILIESKNKKTPGLEFELTITDPGTEVAPGVARTIRHTVWKSDRLGWATISMKQMCEATGVSMTRPDTSEFVNQELKVALSQEPYVSRGGVGKVKNEVAEILKKA